MDIIYNRPISAVIKDKPIITISPKNALAEAGRKMADNGVHHLVVMEGDVVVGVLSHKHIVDSGFTPGLRQINPLMRVEEAMAWEFPNLSIDAKFKDVVKAMVDWGLGVIPIIENGKLVNVITDRDLLRMLNQILGEDEITIDDELNIVAAHPVSQKIMEVANDIGL